jgi:hypothetical protein
MELPELLEIDVRTAPRWSFRVDAGPPPVADAVRLGERRIGQETYSLSRSAPGFRLEYSHAGVFDVSADGTQIVWYRRPDALEELVRAILLGPALALALELAGFLCLHGSAVAIDGRAIVFLGPKHHGKSTVATAMVAAGARLIGDDLIAVSAGPPASVSPGVPSVRLWEDSIAAVGVDSICTRLTRGVKTTASGFAERAVFEGDTPLDAVYILRRAQATEGFTCERTPLAGAAAAVGLAHQAKLPDSLVGTAGARAHVSAAARLVGRVPVFSLSTAWDLTRLSTVVAQLFEWHRDGS